MIGIKTSNRTPLTVSVPSSNIDYKFFNHHNWKGLNTNKNYFDIDQETFEDCNNVYMSEEGLLKSRPAIKLLTENGLQNIVDRWEFGDLKIYKIYDGTYYRLYFVENGELFNYPFPTDENVKLLQFDNRVFIFTPSTIQVYKDKKLIAADDFIYVPQTVVYSNDILSSSGENKNILTSAEITVYLYNNIDKITNTKLYNKTLTIEIDNDVYENVKFSIGLETILVAKKYQLSSENYSPTSSDNALWNRPSFPMIKVQDYDGYTVTLLSSITDVDTSANPMTYTHKVLYSMDNFLFQELYSGNDFYGLPFLAKEHPYVIIVKNDGLYAKNLLENDTYAGYLQWTRVAELTIEPFYTSSAYSDINKNYIAFGGEFNDVNDFVFVYGYNQPDYHPSFYLLKALWSVDGNIYTSFLGPSLSGIDIDGYSNRLNNIELIVKYQLCGDNCLLFIAGSYLGESQSIVNAERLMYLTYSNLLKKDESAADLKSFTFTETETLALTTEISFHLTNSTYDTSNAYHVLKLLYANTYDKITQIYDLTFTIAGELTSEVKQTIKLNDDAHPIINADSLLTSLGLYNLNTTEFVTFNNNVYPIAIDNYLYFVASNHLYTSNLSNSVIKIIEKHDGLINPFLFDDAATLNDLCLSKDNKLYMGSSKSDKDGNKLLYFSNYNTHTFATNINRIYPISAYQIAVFLKDEIWYTNIEELTEGSYATTINKSKLGLSCRKDDDIVTTFDGKYIIFPTKRGLVAMGYQDFIASTEQTLSYMSDSIANVFNDFIQYPVKMTLYKYWLICYRHADGKMLLLDFRTNGWWVFEYDNTIDKIYEDDTTLKLITTGREFYFDFNADNYKDDVFNTNTLKQKLIKWKAVSQKLHLGTLNYYKRIMGLTLNVIQEADISSTLRLKVTNYRNKVDERMPETLEYDIDVLRTFVKRLNYLNVNQFQYSLEYDDDVERPVPLCVDSITTKYVITKQVK